MCEAMIATGKFSIVSIINFYNHLKTVPTDCHELTGQTGKFPVAAKWAVVDVDQVEA